MSRTVYGLVTPALNEQGFIERTIESVLSQTVLPVKWIIVDDGSSDRTAAIAQTYANHYPWITVVRRPAGSARSFASKARSFAAGCEQLKDVRYDYIGNLDADILLTPEYYERLFGFFEADARLGIAGGKFYEIAKDGSRHIVRNSPDSVRGAVQMFRKRCYEDVGGYRPLALGGIDSAAEITARWKGWRVHTFPDLTVLHLRPTGRGSPLLSSVRAGIKDRSLGYYGLFEVVRCGALLTERPYVVGGLGRLVGYCWSWLEGTKSALPIAAVGFLHREQRSKLTRRLKLTASSRMN